MMGRITFFTEWVKSTDDTFEVIEKLLIGYGKPLLVVERESVEEISPGLKDVGRGGI